MAVNMKGKKQLFNVFIACVVVRRRWIKLSTSLATSGDEFLSFDDPSAKK